MAVRSYVLIEAAVGKARAIGEALGKMSHPDGRILSVDTVTGPYDVIVQLESDDLDRLGIVITEGIQRIEGVEKTVTCLSVRLS